MTCILALGGSIFGGRSAAGRGKVAHVVLAALKDAFGVLDHDGWGTIQGEFNKLHETEVGRRAEKEEEGREVRPRFLNRKGQNHFEPRVLLHKR